MSDLGIKWLAGLTTKLAIHGSIRGPVVAEIAASNSSLDNYLGPLYTSPGWLQPASEGQPFYSQPAISIYMTARANPGQPFLPGNPSRDPG